MLSSIITHYTTSTIFKNISICNIYKTLVLSNASNVIEDLEDMRELLVSKKGFLEDRQLEYHSIDLRF